MEKCPAWAKALFTGSYFALSDRLFPELPVQADMLSACLEYEDMLSDKLRGAHPSPQFRRICYPPEQKGAMYQGRAIPLPWGGPGWAPTPLHWRLLRRLLRIKNPDIQFRRITYPPELLLAPNRRYLPSLGEGPGVGVSYAPNGALICQPRATPGGRGCSMDTPPKGAKE